MRILPAIVAVILSACGSGFGSVCDEHHPAVAHARSLSPAQLEVVYSEMLRLRDQALLAREEGRDPYVAFGPYGEPTPSNLVFLKAVRIRPYGEGRPNIMLAGCLDEYVYLNVYESGESGPKIVLSWHLGSEVLWPKK
jgi:hypothetical protein